VTAKKSTGNKQATRNQSKRRNIKHVAAALAAKASRMKQRYRESGGIAATISASLQQQQTAKIKQHQRPMGGKITHIWRVVLRCAF